MKEHLKILVVDDDRRMVKTICDILKVKGFETEAAYSGEEAVTMAQSKFPDCVLMDIKMPGIDGIDTMKILQQKAPGLPVVLMSAHATKEDTEGAKKLGAYTVLSKPIDIQLLLSFLSLLRKEENVLVVDDDPSFCKTLKDILQARGYQVETEIDPEKVLGHLDHNYRLVVVLDLKLGTADGLDVLNKIHARYPAKPVIMVTGYGREMGFSAEKAFEAGARTCLYKPFEAEELIDAIAEISRMKLKEFLNKAE